MIGAGRRVDLQEAHDHANTIDYNFSDVVDFPLVRIQFKSGKELVEQYPKGKIDFKYRNELFNGTKTETH
jgi:hypothetical protein